MSAKRPWFAAPWHEPSDQPDRLRDRQLKQKLRQSGFGEYLCTAAVTALAGPLVAAALPVVLAGFTPRRDDPQDFIGLAVDPKGAPAAEQAALVRALGVRRLLLRVYPGLLDELGMRRRFVEAFGADVSWLIVIPQDRSSVCEPAHWRLALARISDAFIGRCHEFQIGLAPNRTKWGCAHLGDYLPLAEAAMALRDRHPGILLAGPGVIDFEPLVQIRSLINAAHFRFDAAAAALYVDRRGAPSARQYGFFDLRRKIALQVAIDRLSPRLTVAGRRRLWLSETNWPLKDTGAHAPTSQHECVDEPTAASYLSDYYRIAWATGAVERVYWWQLVAPGYGLVDPRGGRLRERPAFAALAGLRSRLAG